MPCWESVRPVPKVTIDFGDGRVMKRTLTGNTVMYVCRPDGRVVDALPGVYTPDDFLAEVRKAMYMLRKSDGKSTGASLQQWHREQVTNAIKAEVMRTTMSKAVVESPLLNALGLRQRVKYVQGKVEVPANAVVDAKTAFVAVSARIDDVSKQPSTAELLRARYARVPPDKQPTPEQFGKMVVEMDSRTNVQLVRPAVHLLFSTYDRAQTTRECRDDVYKHILHVPIDDPNLGLADALVPGTPRN